MASLRHPASIFLLLSLFLFDGIHHVHASSLGNHHGHFHSRIAEDTRDNLPRALAPRETTAATSGQGDYTCGPDKPCYNGACCGADGWCGYGSTYCGDGCQSNCNATAECGQHAASPGETCPLNVCCSEFGFCGTTTDFCSDGCQSNCDQPKPSVATSNSQQRVIGYWEAWNSEHPCGTMTAGAIPATLLTHLNIAFGYISHDFKVTNMDGIPSEMYKNLGNIKSRNPDIKILIALGGWTFSDPGTWQSVFPDVVSTQTNRATFIENLIGFLSEYGYDGVDFDWEYPGAEDRGGSDADAANYVALLRELQAAIASSGTSYIVTFTAPTSYWYLRHFDLKNMEKYVDWINLMSYDLHGVWDSDNPIGSQVLAHSNLTEIDLALDLFWRVDIDPSNIVLGLGFYGRSFTLEDASCWKPGCAFSGPGAAGPCTSTEGILSYREITDILADTGAISYLDKEAAVRYFVYNDNSWISFDDVTTIKSKIEYANKMGLAGLMVWAIDLDDSSLTALRTVSGREYTGETTTPFTLVDIERLFPTELLPADDDELNYGLVNFGGSANSGDMDPSSTAFGFILITSESFAVTQLRKRDGQPDPFVFLDCPENVSDQPKNETQTARVICLSDDVEGCFRVLEQGVEGTIVEMPDNCAPNTFARAISLETSADQQVPADIEKRGPTSEVLEFSFDFNMNLARRDTDKSNVRIDYSNAQGYWDAVVDSPGIQSRDLGKLDERYFAPLNQDWRALFQESDKYEWRSQDAEKVYEDISAPLFWESIDKCPIDGEEFGEGVGGFVTGIVDAEFYYGFSLVARLTSDSFDVKQANGFLKVKGESDLTFGIGGMGEIDIAKAGKNNPTITDGMKVNLGGSSIDVGNLPAWVDFSPFFKVNYLIATFNGAERSEFTDSAAPLNGRLKARVISDFGDFESVFPEPDQNDGQLAQDKRDKNVIDISDDNIMYGSTDDGGKIILGTYFTFGLSLSLAYFEDIESGKSTKITLPEMSIVHNTMTQFKFYAGGGSCTSYDISTRIFQTVENADSVGWGDFGGEANLAYDMQSPSTGDVCYADADTLTKRAGKRLAGWDLLAGVSMKTDDALGGEADVYVNKRLKVNCDDLPSCVSCFDREMPGNCCGCISMDEEHGYSDIEPCEMCTSDDGSWPGARSPTRRDVDEETDFDDEDDEGDEDEAQDVTHQLLPRASGTATLSSKVVKICTEPWFLQKDYRYPAFPADSTFPWENIDSQKWESISRYWGNASADCAIWDVAGLTSADTVNLAGGNTVRAKYQAEHVFEGQVLGDFFNSWLVKGKFKGQSSFTKKPKTKVGCNWISKWILRPGTDFPWKLGQESALFIHLLLAELGSASQLDRLTIYLARPNRKKGSMFSGNQPTSVTKYKAMGNDEQLQSVKELGMTFSYLDNDEVWDAFCGTYEAIYDHFGTFDTWYAKNRKGDTDIALQLEWKNYIREVLDSLVSRSRSTFDVMYRYKKAQTPANQPFWSKWAANVINRANIKIDRICANMDQPR